MMMQNPEDTLFKDLLSDYAAPTPDDGFTQSVMSTIDAETIRTETIKIERLRRGLIYGSSFVGGAIAATQFPALLKIIAGLTPVLPNTAPLPFALPTSHWTFLTMIFLGFVLWAALDRTISELF